MTFVRIKTNNEFNEFEQDLIQNDINQVKVTDRACFDRNPDVEVFGIVKAPIRKVWELFRPFGKELDFVVIYLDNLAQ